MSEIYFEVDLDGGLVGEQGLSFTNTVEAPVPGDTFPADNTYELVLYTGPDLYTEKWHSEGELLPGERVTLNVSYGNKSMWPWEMSDGTSARLTERLPEGMSYVGAFDPGGGEYEPWFYDPDSGIVVWDFDSLGGEDERIFYLVVDLDEDVPLGSVLVNKLEIEGNPDVDVDPVPENNTFELELLIGEPLFLPLVMREH
jgi:hypothetical protein